MTRVDRYAQRPLAEINITPLVDVMLVLLVIFMITAPVLAHKIPLGLPQPTPDVPPPVPTILLTVIADGHYLYDGQPMVTEALPLQLLIEARRKPQPELQLDAARQVSYQPIATALAAAHAAGIARIGFKQIQ